MKPQSYYVRDLGILGIRAKCVQMVPTSPHDAYIFDYVPSGRTPHMCSTTGMSHHHALCSTNMQVSPPLSPLQILNETQFSRSKSSIAFSQMFSKEQKGEVGNHKRFHPVNYYILSQSATCHSHGIAWCYSVLGCLVGENLENWSM